MSKWVGDIVEHRREVRKLKALLLSRAGWSVRQIADFLNMGKTQVSADVNDDISGQLREDILREAAEGMPTEIDIERIVEEIRQERIFAQWGDAVSPSRAWAGLHHDFLEKVVLGLALARVGRTLPCLRLSGSAPPSTSASTSRPSSSPSWHGCCWRAAPDPPCR